MATQEQMYIKFKDQQSKLFLEIQTIKQQLSTADSIDKYVQFNNRVNELSIDFKKNHDSIIKFGNDNKKFLSRGYFTLISYGLFDKALGECKDLIVNSIISLKIPDNEE